MADIVLLLGQSLPPGTKFRWRDMGDGTHALVVYADGLDSDFLRLDGGNVMAADINAGGNALDGVSHIDFDTGAGEPAFKIGRLYWDPVDETPSVMINNGVDPVVLQIGQEQHALVRNNTGVDIANGMVGFVDGSLGFRPTIALCQADDILTSFAWLVSTQAIPKNQNGVVSTFGIVRGLDTQTPGWAEGDLLYLSETVAGELQNTVPTSGYTVIVGRVLRRHPTDGIVFVRPREVPAFGDIVGGNLTEFEFDGTMRARGDATTWRDEIGPVIGQRLQSPGSDIVENLAEGTYTFKSTARYPTDYIVQTMQINHDWFHLSNVEFHTHWWQGNAESANWLIEYRWQVNGQAKTVAWTPVPLTNLIFTYTAGTLNQISDGESTITPPANAGLSDIFQVRQYRDYTNASGLFAGAETSGSDVDAMSSDMHRRSDTMGSRTEYAK